MRIALTLMLLFVVTLTATADTGRRGRWRTTPARPWRVFTGNNVWQPGFDSSYYSPYTTQNTTDSTQLGSTTPTPIPADGQWQTETGTINPTPDANWTQGTTTTPTQTTNPNTTVNPTTTQYFNPIPNVNSETIPSTTTPTTAKPTIPGQTTKSTNHRPSSSASFQLPTPQSNYWNTLNNTNQ